MKHIDKHFGKISAILFLVFFILLANIGYAPQYFNKIFRLSNTIVVVITILFLPICYFTYQKRLIWGYRSILCYLCALKILYTKNTKEVKYHW